MALWRIHLLARDAATPDSSGWPARHLVPSTVEVEEENALKLRRNARKLVYEQLQKPFAITGVERVGKKANKSYDWFSDDPEKLLYVLDEKQQRALTDLKDEIWSRALGGDDLLPQSSSALIDSVTDIKYLSSEVACFYDMCFGGYPPETRILPHERAEKHLAALQKFYSNISSVELQILCILGGQLTQDEMDILRSYHPPVDD